MKRIQFDNEKVPTAFAPLIPYARKWAFWEEGDIEAEIERCSLEEVQQLVSAVMGFEAEGFVDWFGGDAQSGTRLTNEQIAFIRLIDACDYARMRLNPPKR